MSYYEDVLEFHKKFNHPAPEHPTTDFRFVLREQLIDEEYDEVMFALEADWYNRKEEYLTHLAKELVDLVYVTIGTAVEAGIPFDKVWDEVHKSNMAKLGPDGKPVYREDGKTIKPEGWQPPDIHKVMYT